jgi:hypothetical protein
VMKGADWSPFLLDSHTNHIYYSVGNDDQALTLPKVWPRGGRCGVNPGGGIQGCDAVGGQGVGVGILWTATPTTTTTVRRMTTRPSHCQRCDQAGTRVGV